MSNHAALVIAFTGAIAIGCGPTVIVAGEDGDSTGSGSGGGSAGGGGAGAGTGSSSHGSSTASGGSSGSGSGGSSKQWARAFGAQGQQHLRGLAADEAGNVLVTGYFDGTLDFGGGPLQTSPGRSSFVTRLSPEGKVDWSRAITADDCAAAAVAVDPGGNVVVTGFVQGALAVDGEASSMGDGIFVVKLDAGGQLVWQRTYGSSAGANPDRGLAVATDPAGNVLVTGSFEEPIDFGGGLLGSAPGVFAVELDPAGSHLWSRAFDGVEAFGALDGAGRAVVAANLAGGDMRVSAHDTSGAPIWSHTISEGSFQAVGSSAAGDVFLAGIATGADFGGGPLPDALPGGEGFLVKLDALGNHVFSHGLPFDDAQSVAHAVGVDAAGGSVVTGRYEHATGLDGVIQSAFAVALDAGGVVQSSATFGPLSSPDDSLSQEGWGVAPAKDGGFYLGGDFYSAIEVAGETLTGGGSADVFVARLPP